MNDDKIEKNGALRIIPILLVIILLILFSFVGYFNTYIQSSSDDKTTPKSYISASTGLTDADQHAVWFGDINNDTKLDFATAGYRGLKVWTGDGAGTWTDSSGALPNAYDGGICLGDIDNDGNLDIAAANFNYGVGGVGAWLGDGAGAWTPAMSGLPTNDFYTGIFLDDINNDDNLDIAVAHDSLGLEAYVWAGGGSWTPASTNLPTTGKYYSVWMGDVNNDNNTDLAVAGAGIHVWLGNGAGAWTEASTGLTWTDAWAGVAMGDINLDGNLDIVATKGIGSPGFGIRAWLGDGTSNWTEVSMGLPTSGLYYGIVLTDLVGDKYPDILTAGYGGFGIEIWKGDGGTLWTDASSNLPTTGKFLGVDAGDINNDSYLDVVAVGEGVPDQVWMNDAITPPLRVDVQEPDGGEFWLVGTQQYINWSTSGGTAPLTIKIEYAIDGVVGQYTLISNGETDDGTYQWTIPSTPSSNCFVRVNVTDSSVQPQTNWDKSNSSFTIFLPDTLPPTISNVQPVNQSTISETKPVISADYSDASGINTSSVYLFVDLINETLSANIGVDNITYTPPSDLSEGTHDVYLEARDASNNQNLATKSWWFNIDKPAAVEAWEPGGGLGQTYTIGDIVNVTWNASDSNPLPPIPINISYGDPILSWTIISSNEVNDGIYFWNTTNVPCPGTYWINITVYDSIGQESYDLSNYSFDMFCPGDSPPLITVYEAGGNPSQTYTEGDFVSVKWSATDNNPLPPNPINITYGDPMSTWTTITTNEQDDGLYVWDTTSVPCPDTFWMNISVRDSIGQTTYDESNFSFQILCQDTTPPMISNSQPMNQSTIGSSAPTISANYSDATGIDTNSVILKLDGVFVTSFATIGQEAITYTASDLLEGLHSVYLEVADNSTNQNTATKTWWFIVDITPPTISNLNPGNESVIGDDSPIISASYGDSSTIETGSVMLKLDSFDITASAIVSASGVSYVVSAPLIDGIYNITLEVADNSNPQNKAVKIWWFNIDTTPPEISNLQPVNNSAINNGAPIISANYSDASGISIVILKVDYIDVTAYATIAVDGVSYTPAPALIDTGHIVHLEVKDGATPPNPAMRTWIFSVDTTPPEISHEPVTSGNPGNDLTITADVTDESGVDTVTLYYRKSGTGPFDQMSMTLTSGDIYTATIPGSVVTIDGIQYYIEAHDTLDNTAQRPRTNWASFPYEIDASEAAGFPWWLLVVIAAIVLALIIFLMYWKRRTQETEEDLTLTYLEK